VKININIEVESVLKNGAEGLGLLSAELYIQMGLSCLLGMNFKMQIKKFYTGFIILKW